MSMPTDCVIRAHRAVLADYDKTAPGSEENGRLFSQLEITAMLDDFPSTCVQIRGLDVKYKAILLRQELKTAFPDAHFRVSPCQYIGKSFLTVMRVGKHEVDETAVKEIIGKYSCLIKKSAEPAVFECDNYLVYS